MNAKNNDGFSLIEVVIAIAVLAILVMPLLSYFTNASISTSRGKDTQKATMAGQSVSEELNTYDTFDQLEALHGDWTVISSGPAASELTKTVVVDGTSYEARVGVDYHYSTTDSNGNTTESKYNSYDTPQLTEVYSENNVVLAESDQTSTAVSNLYYTNTSVSKSQIEAAMTRTLVLDVSKDVSDSSLYVVKGYYVYRYHTDVYKAQIRETKIEVSKLKNIYLFYNLLREDILNEAVEVNFSNVSIAEAQKMNLYFVCQESGVTKPSGYSLNVSGTGNYLQTNFYTNGIPSSTVSVQSELVSHSKGKRIAMLTVDIYRAGETTYNDSTRLARIQTSKGA